MSCGPVPHAAEGWSSRRARLRHEDTRLQFLVGLERPGRLESEHPPRDDRRGKERRITRVGLAPDAAEEDRQILRPDAGHSDGVVALLVRRHHLRTRESRVRERQLSPCVRTSLEGRRRIRAEHHLRSRHGCAVGAERGVQHRDVERPGERCARQAARPAWIEEGEPLGQCGQGGSSHHGDFHGVQARGRRAAGERVHIHPLHVSRGLAAKGDRGALLEAVASEGDEGPSRDRSLRGLDLTEQERRLIAEGCGQHGLILRIARGLDVEITRRATRPRGRGEAKAGLTLDRGGWSRQRANRDLGVRGQLSPLEEHVRPARQRSARRCHRGQGELEGVSILQARARCALGCAHCHDARQGAP